MQTDGRERDYTRFRQNTLPEHYGLIEGQHFTSPGNAKNAVPELLRYRVFNKDKYVS